MEAPPKGADITVEYKSTTGYTLTETPANANGTFLKEPQTVTYIYSKDPVPAEPVTVNYVDDKGKELAPSETFTGFIDDPYVSLEKTIDGYSLVSTPTNASGKLTANEQIVNYIYQKILIPAEPVTVNYISDTGEKLADQTLLKGNIGDPFSTSPETITGYKLKTTPTNAKGTFSDKTQTIEYVYEKKKNLLKKGSTLSVKPNNSTSAPTEISAANKPKLPKTGDTKPLDSTLAGLFLLASTIILWRKNSH